jgi:hypothetical protein
VDFNRCRPSGSEAAVAIAAISLDALKVVQLAPQLFGGDER